MTDRLAFEMKEIEMNGAFRRPMELRVRAIVFGVSSMVLGGLPAFAQRGPSFQGLGAVVAPGHKPGTFALGVSADGSVVVGFGEDTTGVRSVPFRWTRTSGYLVIPEIPGGIDGIAWAASADGSVVVGSSNLHRAWSLPFRWTSSSGTVSLGDLPGGNATGAAVAVSTDGSVVVGASDSGSGQEAFRWTQASGMVGLGFLPGTVSSSASDISADGSVIIGNSFGPLGPGLVKAFRWTADQGMVAVPLSGGFSTSAARLLSADGSVVAGLGRNAAGFDEVYRWTAAGGMVGLGFNIDVNDISADGSVLVGESDFGTAFIWDAEHGLRILQNVLEDELGLDVTGWELRGATGVSDDGRVVVGWGRSPQASGEAWIAILNECGTDVDCSDGLFCNGQEACSDNVCFPAPAAPCSAGLSCDEASDYCSSAACAPPSAAAEAARYVRVTPADGVDPVGINLAPLCDVTRVQYVSAPTTSGSFAVASTNPALAAFRTPAEWAGPVNVSGVDVAPGTSYAVWINCGTAEAPLFSPAVTVTTAQWGDAAGAFVNGAWPPPDGSIDVTSDALAILDGFTGQAFAPPLHRLDMTRGGGCRPDQIIDILDIVAALDAFRGLSYGSSTGCSTPCAGAD